MSLTARIIQNAVHIPKESTLRFAFRVKCLKIVCKVTRTVALHIHPLRRIGCALIAWLDPTFFSICATRIAIVTGTAVFSADDFDPTAGTGEHALVDALVSCLANVERVDIICVDARKSCHE